MPNKRKVPKQPRVYTRNQTMICVICHKGTSKDENQWYFGEGYALCDEHGRMLCEKYNKPFRLIQNIINMATENYARKL